MHTKSEINLLYVMAAACVFNETYWGMRFRESVRDRLEREVLKKE